LDEYAFRNKIIESKTTETNKTAGTTNEATIVKPKSVNETSYRHGPTDFFSIGASSSATRFYLTKSVLVQGGSLLYPTPFLITRQKAPT
ncbi:hypothetical protein Tco_0113966, partial [Tanacetum coccineum]